MTFRFDRLVRNENEGAYVLYAFGVRSGYASLSLYDDGDTIAMTCLRDTPDGIRVWDATDTEAALAEIDRFIGVDLGGAR